MLLQYSTLLNKDWKTEDIAISGGNLIKSKVRIWHSLGICGTNNNNKILSIINISQRGYLVGILANRK